MKLNNRKLANPFIYQGYESPEYFCDNYSLVERNWRIGQRIVEQEQNGALRAEYGKHVIEVASAALTEEFGKGFSKTNIMNFKKFYLKFKELTILQTLSEEFKKQKQQTCLLNLLCYPKKVRHCLTFLYLIFV